MIKSTILAAAIAVSVATPVYAVNISKGELLDGFKKPVKLLSDYPMHDGSGGNGGGSSGGSAGVGAAGGSAGSSGGSSGGTGSGSGNGGSCGGKGGQ